jgi:hypothetical protein
MLFFKQENIGIQLVICDLILLVQEEINPRNELFMSNVRHYYLSNEVSGIRKASLLLHENVKEARVKRSSSLNSIDYIEIDSLILDSNEEEQIE